MSDSQQYCTTRTAALRLGVSRQRISQLVSDGRLTGRSDRKGWMFDLAEIERLAALPRQRRWNATPPRIKGADEIHPTSEAVYLYIVQFKREHAGESPVTREIAAALGLSSTSVVQHHLEKLEKAGLIMRSAGKSRMISIPGARWVMEDESDELAAVEE